jgi:integrase
MAPRKRSFAKRDLPANLYENDGYYSWKDPRTGKHYGIGRDKKAAIRQANEANFAINGELEKARLVDRINGDAERTFENFIPIYEAELDKRELAETTLRWRKQRLHKVKAELGSCVLARVSTLQISAILDAIEAEGKARMAQVYRSELHDFFRSAEAKGWIDKNPVTVTKAADAKVKRERLTLEAFTAIYAKALEMEPWVANSIALGLVTAQRREDISKMQFSDIQDGFLYVEPGKTEKTTGIKIRIPVKLKLEALGWTLESIVKQCRQGILGNYMVRNDKNHAKAKAGKPLHVSSLSAGFAEARKATGLKFIGTPPSFHELRSLAKRLYDEQGIDTKTLLGHKTEQMASLYGDVRGAEWLEVKV